LTLAARNKEPHPKLTKQVKVQVTGIQWSGLKNLKKPGRDSNPGHLFQGQLRWPLQNAASSYFVVTFTNTSSR
jgi:hypothetical protein